MSTHQFVYELAKGGFEIKTVGIEEFCVLTIPGLSYIQSPFYILLKHSVKIHSSRGFINIRTLQTEHARKQRITIASVSKG